MTYPQTFSQGDRVALSRGPGVEPSYAIVLDSVTAHTVQTLVTVLPEQAGDVRNVRADCLTIVRRAGERAR